VRRLRAGDYVEGWPIRYRVVHGWGDSRGWVVLELAPDGTADVIADVRTLRDARAELERIGGDAGR